MTDDKDQSSERLMQQFLSTEMSDEEAQCLLDRLKNEPRLRRDFIEQREMDVLLQWLFHEDRPEDVKIVPEPDSVRTDDFDWDALVHLAHSSPKISMPAPRAVREDKRTKPFSKQKIGRLPLLAVALLLFCGIFAVYHEWTRQPNSVMETGDYLGRVVSIVDPVWPEDAAVLKENQRINAEPIRLESGLMEIVLNNGISIILEGPTEFQIDSPLTTFCKSGKLSVHVPPEGTGFVVETPKLTVRDIGTDFFMLVTPEHSEVHVIKGTVEANWMTKEWHTVHEGRGISSDRNNVPSRIVSDKSRFIPREEMARRVEADRLHRKEIWETASRQQNGDPTLWANFNFDEVRSSTCPNLAASSNVSDLTVSGRRNAGRWSGSGALLADAPNLSAYVDVPDKTDSLTMIAVLKLNRLDRACQGIFMSRSFGPGKILWHFNHKGAVQFMVQPAMDRAPIKYESPAFFTGRDCETWFQLAVVVDAKKKTVSHYYDGRLVVSLPMDRPIPIEIGRADIGNWISDGKSIADRSLNGAVDEFLLFNRALSTEEIQKYFESSK